jgi:glycerol-3-phosphate acyltransferase PlsX
MAATSVRNNAYGHLAEGVAAHKGLAAKPDRDAA